MHCTVVLVVEPGFCFLGGETLLGKLQRENFKQPLTHTVKVDQAVEIGNSTEETMQVFCEWGFVRTF